MKILTRVQEYPAIAAYQLKNKPIPTSITSAALVGGAVFTVAGIGITVVSLVLLAGPAGTALVVIGMAVGSSGCSGLVVGSVFYGILFDEAIFSFYRKKHSHYTANGKPVLLVLTAAYDHNGVLDHNKRNFFAKLEKDYNIVFKKVSSAKQMKKEIRQIGQIEKIGGLWIEAHGDPAGITLGNGKKDVLLVYSKELKKVSKVIRNNLTKKAPIILNSCSTAGDLEIPSQDHKKALPVLNIAESIAYNAKRKVYAPKGDVASGGIKLASLTPLKVEFSSLHDCFAIAMLELLSIKKKKKVTVSISAKAAKIRNTEVQSHWQKKGES